ncbi:MAG: hypothetical protein DMF84_14020 [Acidobacteria bacterium]|nr:MAG: hypothetical protein DMF84_14020 [Acidobacteriota bacterium]
MPAAANTKATKDGIHACGIGPVCEFSWISLPRRQIRRRSPLPFARRFHRTDAALPTIDMQTERQQIADTIAKPRAFALLTTVSGIIGLLLACVGVYGIVSQDAVRRTHEIGVRMALGAGRAQVLRLVMRQTMIVAIVGAAIGFGLAMAASRLIAGSLFAIPANDPLAIGSALAVLLAVAFAAAYVPARRATELDPTQALRYE